MYWTQKKHLYFPMYLYFSAKFSFKNTHYLLSKFSYFMSEISFCCLYSVMFYRTQLLHDITDMHIYLQSEAIEVILFCFLFYSHRFTLLTTANELIQKLYCLL